MKYKCMLYHLVLLTYLHLLGVVVGAALHKESFVDGEHMAVYRKVKGRYSSHIVPQINNGQTSGAMNKRQVHDTKDENINNVGKKFSTATQAPITGPKSDRSGNSSTPKPNNKGNHEGAIPVPMADLVDMKTVFFILLGVTSLLIGCFVFKLVRSKSRRKTKKYGILATHGSEVELTPLEQDDEDEDMTVFDANST